MFERRFILFIGTTLLMSKWQVLYKLSCLNLFFVKKEKFLAKQFMLCVCDYKISYLYWPLINPASVGL